MANCQSWRDTTLSDRYIIIPEDLFASFTRSPTTIDLTLTHSQGGTPRTAGTYPPPRPITSSNWKKRPLKDYRVIGLDRVSAMEGISADEDPDDIINLVARANTSRNDSSNMLPRIRASPCQMHAKQSRRQLDLLYSSNHHGGKVPGHHEQVTLKSHKEKLHRQSVKCSFGSKPREQRDPPSNPVVYKTTTLPSNCQSQDFVMSWLIHGSAPEGENHFPEIVKDGQKSKTSQRHHRLRGSLLSE